MKLKRMLEDGYIVGLQTIGQAYYNVYRNSHLYFADKKVEMELAELTRHIRNYADDTLITDILTQKEMESIDKQLKEDLGSPTHIDNSLFGENTGC